MSHRFDIQEGDRVLVVVPHPDDETLATGGLIQIALAAGAHVRVLIVTDGDDNPWPQRWLEKRWHIDAEARARWGARRRDEARSALSIAGVASQSVRHFGWPDQGITGLLMRDADAENHLAEEIREFEPGIVVCPALVDHHPDHSALRVMLELALSRTRYAHALRLGYVVHGSLQSSNALSLSISGIQQQTKQRALLAHATQLSLSRRRLQKMGERIEQFETSVPNLELSSESHQVDGLMPWATHHRWTHRYQLLLVVGCQDNVIRAHVPLSRHACDLRSTIGTEHGLDVDVQVQIADGLLKISLSSRSAIRRAYAKIQRIGSRLFIYDASGWHDLSTRPIDIGNPVRPERSAAKSKDA